MKANAPEKLYFFEGETILSARSKKIEDANIEYVRTDAFVKKVINFLKYKLDDIVATRVPGTIIPHHVAKQELIEDFRKYIGGE